MYKVISKNDKNLQEYLKKLERFDSDFECLDTSLYFIVEDLNGVIAYACINSSMSSYELTNIVVKSEFRYHSYGTKLINFIVSTGMRNNIQKIIVKKIQGDDTFFLKSGFFIDKNSHYVLDNIQQQRLRTREGVKGTLVSIFINILLSALKISIGILGKSRALVADGFHSISDVIGSFVVLFSVIFGGRPEDEDHPYGHEKIESIAGNIVGTMLILTSVELIKNSFQTFFSDELLTRPSKVTMLVALSSIIIKFSLYLYKENIGEKTNNDAIKADAREHKSDSISSLGVLIGIALAIYVNPIFDLVLSILVSLFIGKEGVMIIFETSNTLLDKQDKELIEEIENYVRHNSSVGNIHDTLMRVSGDKVFLSFHIRLPKDMTVYEAHVIADELKYSLLEDFISLKDVTIHIDYIH